MPPPAFLLESRAAQIIDKPVQLFRRSDVFVLFVQVHLHADRKGEKISSRAAAAPDQIVKVVRFHKITPDLWFPFPPESGKENSGKENGKAGGGRNRSGFRNHRFNCCGSKGSGVL